MYWHETLGAVFLLKYRVREISILVVKAGENEQKTFTNNKGPTNKE